ncbi:hypothetical protein GALL_538360 [mine drainage metagenome]|uniref:Uncharacterized protein n=1 Tax=mine drainage metagenome TaxID=410659 RepID=A0A1J5PAX2_9ZZZZ
MREGHGQGRAGGEAAGHADERAVQIVEIVGGFMGGELEAEQGRQAQARDRDRRPEAPGAHEGPGQEGEGGVADQFGRQRPDRLVPVARPGNTPAGGEQGGLGEGDRRQIAGRLKPEPGGEGGIGEDDQDDEGQRGQAERIHPGDAQLQEPLQSGGAPGGEVLAVGVHQDEAGQGEEQVHPGPAEPRQGDRGQARQAQAEAGVGHVIEIDPERRDAPDAGEATHVIASSAVGLGVG